MKPLSEKQQAFVGEYLIDLNATQAAIRAGYSKKTAKQIATENLSKPAIANAIQSKIHERSNRTEVKADYVLRQAVKLHERCMQETQPADLNTEGSIGGHRKAQYAFNASGAAKALQLIGNHVDVQAFQDKRVISGPDGEAIQVDHQFTVEFIHASSQDQ